MGKKSALKQAMKGLRDVPPEERPKVAQSINEALQTAEAELAAAAVAIERAALEARLGTEWVDATMPGVAQEAGALHPLTRVKYRCMEVLRRMGFELEEGPVVCPVGGGGGPPAPPTAGCPVHGGSND